MLPTLSLVPGFVKFFAEFVVSCRVSCRYCVISAKNCTILDNSVWPGIVQFFAEFLPNFCGPSLIAG